VLLALGAEDGGRIGFAGAASCSESADVWAPAFGFLAWPVRARACVARASRDTVSLGSILEVYCCTVPVLEDTRGEAPV